MSRKRTRRRVYALVNPILHAISGAALIPQDELDRLRIRELAAVAAFASGRAGIAEWRDMCDLMNIAETMGREGVGPEVLPVCAAAQGFLIDAKERFERTGRMGTTGPGLQSFRELYELHDLQRQAVSRAEYEGAITLTAARLRSPGKGVVVLK